MERIFITLPDGTMISAPFLASTPSSSTAASAAACSLVYTNGASSLRWAMVNSWSTVGEPDTRTPAWSLVTPTTPPPVAVNGGSESGSWTLVQESGDASHVFPLAGPANLMAQFLMTSASTATATTLSPLPPSASSGLSTSQPSSVVTTSSLPTPATPSTSATPKARKRKRTEQQPHRETLGEFLKRLVLGKPKQAPKIKSPTVNLSCANC